MPNTIRTPKQGVTVGSRRIAEAVDNEEWQKFRLSLKGIPTQDKLALLLAYMDERWDGSPDTEDEYIRVDNYLKALARGGQIYVVAHGDYVNRLNHGTLTIKK
jgi:hypothetical protein